MLVLQRFSERTLQQGRSFAGLMELFELNFLQLRALLPSFRGPAIFRSRVEDGLDLFGQVLEQHRYTTDIRLTYLFREGGKTRSDPDARIRAYHDARVAEMTACSPGARVARLCGLQTPDRYMLERTWVRNCFLYKWLDYLHGCGHSLASVQLLDPGVHDLFRDDSAANAERVRVLDTPGGLA